MTDAACRIPWEGDVPLLRLRPGTALSWLPQPAEWAELARDEQAGVEGSTLELYKLALRLRRELGLASGTLEWLGAEELTRATTSSRSATAASR